MNPENPEPGQTPEEAPATAPNPIDELALPHTEPHVISKVNPYRKLFIGLGILVLLAGMATGYVLFHKSQKTSSNSPVKTSTSSKTNSAAKTAQGLSLDPAKNYGDKYANGLLPVGDNHYLTAAAAAKAGYIYVCANYANNLTASQGGAGGRGPWFVNNNTQYDVNKKLHVLGDVMWQASFSNKVSGATRTIITNDLPNHATGTFPVSPTDPSYAYDRNPNHITEQSLTYSLSSSPAYGTPNCMGGQVGVMLTGVVLYNGFDAEGRDGGAWEIQDGCSGHPQKDGQYHYHTLSSCIKDINAKTVIGFALDGFPITGPQVSPGNILTTSDLDACHGLTSQIVLDGKTTTSYHYVMTQDFPYSVSCFRAAPAAVPGQPNAG